MTTSDDDMVTLEVQMTEQQAKDWATHPVEFHPLARAAREWVAVHDKPERRVYRLYDGAVNIAAAVVAVEDLEPGDRVAGRKVTAVSLGADVDRPLVSYRVDWEGGHRTMYAPGTLVVLDPDGAA